MLTECSANEIDFGRAGSRRVVADFDGGMVSSDAGALLLVETDQAIKLVDRFALRPFTQRRGMAKHPVEHNARRSHIAVAGSTMLSASSCMNFSASNVALSRAPFGLPAGFPDRPGWKRPL